MAKISYEYGPYISNYVCGAFCCDWVALRGKPYECCPNCGNSYLEKPVGRWVEKVTTNWFGFSDVEFVKFVPKGKEQKSDLMEASE